MSAHVLVLRECLVALHAHHRPCRAPVLVLDTHVFPKAALIAIRVATMDARRQMLGMVTAAAKVDKGLSARRGFSSLANRGCT